MAALLASVLLVVMVVGQGLSASDAKHNVAKNSVSPRSLAVATTSQTASSGGDEHEESVVRAFAYGLVAIKNSCAACCLGCSNRCDYLAKDADGLSQHPEGCEQGLLTGCCLTTCFDLLTNWLCGCDSQVLCPCGAAAMVCYDITHENKGCKWCLAYVSRSARGMAHFCQKCAANLESVRVFNAKVKEPKPMD